MKTFLDSASITDIVYWSELGLVDGITTNPALLGREGGDPIAILKQIAELVSGPVSAQVTAVDVDGMINQGKRLAALADNIVVKVPATVEGARAARVLHEAGVPLNITLGFDATQMLPFSRIPVDYFSLIVGRVEDVGTTSVDQISAARGILDRVGTTTKLLVASIRNPLHLRAAALGGADVITVPPSTWANLLANPHTLRGLSDFSSAWLTLDRAARDPYDALAREAD